MTDHVYMVDVFAEQPYSGNPLAVIVGKEFLPDKTMQRIAAEMNFSETTLVLSVPEDNGGYRVRVFTPSREIAFTGHPILGTAWVVQQYLVTEPDTEVRLNLAVGQVPVHFESSTSGRGLAWFLAPTMSLEATSVTEPVATALGLTPEDINTSAPIQVVSAGTSAIIVPLNSLDALRRSQLNLEAFAPLAADGFPPLMYLFNTFQNQICPCASNRATKCVVPRWSCSAQECVMELLR